MLYIKAALKEGERVRSACIESGVYDSGRKVRREGDRLLIPVTERIDGKQYEYVEAEDEYIESRPRTVKDALTDVLSDSELEVVPSSFDVIGDIAVFELPTELVDKKGVIGEAYLKVFKNIKVACLKTGKVDTTYRVPGIEVVAGEKRTETIHSENGCRFKIDIAKVYFSPRSGTERQRVTGKIMQGERVLVLFAGVGPFAIEAAKKENVSVVAVELNPEGCRYMRENAALNKVDVEVIEGDAAKATPTLGLFERIIMPLPKDAASFLDTTIPALKPGGVIHYYCFDETVENAGETLEKQCRELGYDIKIIESVYCGSFNPSTSRICLDFTLNDTGATL